MYSNRITRLFNIGILAVAGAFFVTGCKTVGPDFEKPEVPVADTWLEAENERVDTSSTSYQDWWDVFDDPVLSKLIDTAYEQNLSLQVAGLRVIIVIVLTMVPVISCTLETERRLTEIRLFLPFIVTVRLIAKRAAIVSIHPHGPITMKRMHRTAGLVNRNTVMIDPQAIALGITIGK